MEKMFEKAIKAFLDDKARTDGAFAEKYQSEKKSIAECCKYIISEVKKSCKGSSAACTDEYVYGLAIHYYDEDIKVPENVPSCSVVVPGNVELTEEDRKEAKEEALRRLKEKEVADQMEAERKRKEAAEKRAEAARRRKEEEMEKKRKAFEESDLLFRFDDEEGAR